MVNYGIKKGFVEALVLEQYKAETTHRKEEQLC